jgi:hypothetical protein
MAMINRPETRDLLAEARQVLLDSLAPELSGERKYEALMIANAMGMAIREQEQQEAGEPEATDVMLSRFLAGHVLPEDPGQGEQTLARALRERVVDGGNRELREVLRAMTETRLKVNNPGYLK